MAVVLVCALTTVVDSAAVSVDRSALPSVLQCGRPHVACLVEWKAVAVVVVCALSPVVDVVALSVDRSALPSVLRSHCLTVS